MQQEFRLDLGGRPLIMETGKLAGQANGSVLLRYGDTVVLVTATMSREPRRGIDFFPLLVDFEEKMYSIGKIPRVWLRREGRPTEMATLTMRMIDRTLRPLFPDGFRNDVQVVATVLSADRDFFPDIPAMIGASAALTISDIPFDGPIAGVRVARVGEEFIINPTVDQESHSDMDLVVGGTKDAVMMVEAGANELSEEIMLDAIMFGHEEIKKVVAAQEDMARQIGKEKAATPLFQVDAEIESWVKDRAEGPIRDAMGGPNKQEREDTLAALKNQLISDFSTDWGQEVFDERGKQVEFTYDKLIKQQVRQSITKDKKRPDGRGPDEVRPIWCEVGVLPRTHGSAIFTRGQTQALSVVTLGLKSDEQMIDDLRDDDRKRYIHHYNFPSFSVGEVRPMRGPGRREIGHGALAERALLPVIPPEDEFPYTMRVVSEILESNGSTSMASVCGSTLGLMDAGCPLRKPVAGVAMGMVKHEDDFAILTDIQGMEDALGDMDFKVAGTRDGITALQMDIKISGVSREILGQALEQALKGRLFILEKMLAVLDTPRGNLSHFAPRIIKLQIPVDKIREVIGPGGRMIHKIIEQTGVDIDIQDDGRVFIASTDEDAGQQAVKLIEALTKEIEVGTVYMGKVKRIMNFGAFVEILPGKEGLVHISQLSPERVGKVEDVVNIGDDVLVKVTEIDRMGRINLSRKDALPDAENSSNGRTAQGGRDGGDRGRSTGQKPQGGGRPPRRS